MSEPRSPSYGAIRKAITDSYYDSRNEGETMETAADLAANRVVNLISQGAAPDVQRLTRAIVNVICGWQDEAHCGRDACAIAAEYLRLSAEPDSEAT